MCYAEDAGAASQLRNDCAPLPGTITVSYDCGRDDYFSPAPDPGSYLADPLEHVRLRVHGAGCDTLAPACGGERRGDPGARPPRRTGADDRGQPRRRGATLKATTGDVDQPPDQLQVPLAARVREDVAVDQRRRPRAATGRPRATSGGACAWSVAATNDDGTTATASAPTAPVGAVGLNKTATARSKR